MNKKTFLKWGVYAVFPAFLFCIPTAFFINNEQFSQSWLLFVGNALFLCSIFLFVLKYPKVRDTNLSLQAGLAVTLIAILFSCILLVICILIFAPGLFDIGYSNVALQNTPAALPSKNHHGILLMLLIDVTVGNIIAGSFGSVMASASKRINKDDKG